MVEIDSQIEICLVLGYLNSEDLVILKGISNEVFAMLSAMK